MTQNKTSIPKIGIIGAGPAGLTAAYLLAKQGGFDVQVFEKDPFYVGGISRTESFKGYHFDIGGHRFFSKSEEVEAFWSEILGDELLDRPRKSRIYYNHRFFDYPLSISDALKKLGVVESARCVASYLAAKLKPVPSPRNFEDWVTNQFGERLYRLFFKTYTEKVWGIDCREISADWAAQRIKGLSVFSAIRHAVFPPKNKGEGQIKTLIDSFRYPKYGPGQMWETCRDKATAMGATVHMNAAVKNLTLCSNGKWSLEMQDGECYDNFDHIISSAPIRELVKGLRPSPSEAIRKGADSLNYRDFLTVILILEDKHSFNDNWIYIHDPAVKVGRIQNFKSWSPYMVPSAETACYGLEYFCFEGDELWNAGNDDLAKLAIAEMEQIGLAKKEDIKETYVVRQAKAYPVYDHAYQQHIDVIKEGLKAYPGLILAGRNGMHKYNNQDHSMMTAMLAVKNIIAGKELYDLWQVNQDAEYHETATANNGGRFYPEKIN